MKDIYFDSAATTPVKPEVLAAMMPYFTDRFYNPNSSYNKARQVSAEIDKARETIARSINAEPENIIFTSGGSESNCTAIRGFCEKHYKNARVPSVVATTIEHHSTLSCLELVNGQTVGVNEYGYIRKNELTHELLPYFSLLTICGGNNEIGTIQNIREIAEIVHNNNALLHVDAVQLFGHHPIDVQSMGIDMMSASAHKIGGPKGVGFLYVKHPDSILPLINGTQEGGLRGGTLNVPGIIGFARAVELCDIINLRQKAMRDYMIAKLQDRFGCKLNGAVGDNRLYNNVNVTFPQNIKAEQLIFMLGESNIMCSAGSACNAGNPKPSHVLKAIGLTDEEAQRTVRFTLPEEVTQKDIDTAVDMIDAALGLIS